MAITVTPKILGQTANSTNSYCYLYEPLRVFIEEDDITATKLTIDIQLIDTDIEAVIETLSAYVEADILPNVGTSIDLMQVVRQINDANIWKFASVNQLSSATGWKTVLGQYRYKFLISTDITTVPVEVYKTPISGGRDYEQFLPAVDETSPTNEFQYLGLNETELQTRFSGVTFITIDLSAPSSTLSIKPTITKITNSGTPLCGGFLIWKSRFGGWMFWGFDFQTETKSKNYTGNLTVDMYEDTLDKNGETFVPVNYTQISTSYSRTLKALNLTSNELRAVAGIDSSPAVYYRHLDGRLELMRVTSANAPISTLANGGDFTVSLSSISRTSQLTI